MPKERLGRVLGPAKNHGNIMTQWVLTSNGTIVPRRTLRRLKEEELHNPTELQKRDVFTSVIQSKLGDSMTPPPQDTEDSRFDEATRDDEVSPRTMPENEITDCHGTPLCQQSIVDKLIGAEVLLPQGEAESLARVVRWCVDSNGKITGSYNDNPVLNTLLYEVEFPDGSTKPYAANVIANNIFEQVDIYGFCCVKLDSILEFRKDGNAVDKADQYIVTKRGRRKLRLTTAGWHLLIKLSDGTERWAPLSEMKEANPIEVAEFAVSNRIADEPAFKWWVGFTLKKRDRIIASVRSRVLKRTHKYGIEIPSSIDHAKELDRQNKNTLWMDALEKEMYNVSVAFQILENDEYLPPGYTPRTGHLVWDLKMDFTRKARWVKDGHKTPNPEGSSFAGVVSRDTVRIALTYAALNGIPVTAADIRNAYLQAPASEKHYIICGAEFGLEHMGKRALVKRALYGGKVAGRDYWEHLRECMDFMGFKSSYGDPELWMRPGHKADGTEYWEYVLLYVDDVLVISVNGDNVLRNEIGKYFELKEESVGPPKIYLGGKLSLITLENGQEAWSFSSSHYVQAAVHNVEQYLAKHNQKLPNKAKASFTSNYRPETDLSEELGNEDTAYYQSLIGILRWMVELGRVDICCEVSQMSSHLAFTENWPLATIIPYFRIPEIPS